KTTQPSAFQGSASTRLSVLDRRFEFLDARDIGKGEVEPIVVIDHAQRNAQRPLNQQHGLQSRSRGGVQGNPLGVLTEPDGRRPVVVLNIFTFDSRAARLVELQFTEFGARANRTLDRMRVEWSKIWVEEQQILHGEVNLGVASRRRTKGRSITGVPSASGDES